MTDIDVEATATRAIQQARLLSHRAELAANVATHQAVALLHAEGMSHRQIAKVTGISKSDVARKLAGSPPLGIAQRTGADSRVYDFALEWIWGSADVRDAAMLKLLDPQDAPPPRRGLATNRDKGYSGTLPTNFGGTNRPPGSE